MSQKSKHQVFAVFAVLFLILAIPLTVLLGSKQQVVQNQAATLAASPIKTVFIVMMENLDWSAVKGNASAPYINGTLLPQYAHAENYVSPMHPSLPNYITLEAGSNVGLTGGTALPTTNSLTTTAHLTTLMKNAGISWKYYGESLPGNGTTCNLTDPGAPYSEDHNPFVYFQDVSGNPPSASNAYCIQHERSYMSFAADLQSGSIGQYNFIVPNDYDEGEKFAPGSTCKLCQADAWLKSNIPVIQASAAYQNATIFIVWDEGTFPTHNPSGLIAVSPFSKKNYSNMIAYSHGSTVRTVEEIFGLSPLLGTAANATDLSDLFTVPVAGGGGGTPGFSGIVSPTVFNAVPSPACLGGNCPTLTPTATPFGLPQTSTVPSGGGQMQTSPNPSGGGVLPSTGMQPNEAGQENENEIHENENMKSKHKKQKDGAIRKTGKGLIQLVRQLQERLKTLLVKESRTSPVIQNLLKRLQVLLHKKKTLVPPTK